MDHFVSFGSTVWTIVEKAKANDREAITAILKSYRPPIVNFCLARGIIDQDAEDIAQETLIRLVETISKVDKKKGKFRSLILGIAKNVIREQIRTKMRHDKINEELAEKDEQDQESFDRLWVENIVRLAMNRLRKEKENYFKALYMISHENLSYEEVCKSLDLDLQTVKNHIHRARLRLKNHIIEIIREYSLEDEYESELNYISRLIER